jgi:phage shock protein PspC (stress-responsive transcriptional regulator)
MKPIEKVSIGGYAFTLEKEASQAVASYLKEMSSFYPNPEIVEGIEERMAELLLERTPQNGVVTLASVQQIIDILGRPEKIEEEEPERTVTEEKPKKKLYRDMENARVAGVCSGLAAYFDVDPAVFRILFLVCSVLGVFSGVHNHVFFLPFTVAFISFPTLYLILWICMPAARTARQRWEQKGEDGTAESIRRSIESGAAEIGEAANRIGNYPAWGRFGRAVEIIMGLVLFIVAVSGLFAGGLGLFGWEWLGFRGSIDSLITEATREYPRFATVLETPWVQGLAIAVCVLPFIGLLYGSIMMIFHFKSPSWHPGLVIFIIWLLAVVALAILSCAVVFSADLQHSYYALHFW